MKSERVFIKMILVTYDPSKIEPELLEYADYKEIPPDRLSILNFEHIRKDEEQIKSELHDDSWSMFRDSIGLYKEPFEKGFQAIVFLSNGTDYDVYKTEEKQWSWSQCIKWSADKMESGDSETFEGTLVELCEHILVEENSRMNKIQEL